MADRTINYEGISADRIDQLLDEIEQNEEEKLQPINWKVVRSKIINCQMTYVKALVSSNTVDLNEQDEKGKTLLIYCAISGNLDMVSFLSTFGADIFIKDKSGYSALDYAQKFGYYRIAELLYFTSLSSSVGGELKEKAELMFDKKQQTTFLLKHIDSNGKLDVIEYMIEAISLSSPFSDDLMLLSWELNLGRTKKAGLKWNESKLWKQMMLTFESILKNTDNLKGWKWLKKYFVASNIWLLPHPDEDGKLTLFNELLERTQAENQRQGELLLTKKIKSIKKTDSKNWNNLCKFDVKSTLIKYENVRQDADIFKNSIKAPYNENQLTKYTQTSSFNPIQHVNLNLYLQQLLFYANIMDDDFQQAMKSITNQILSNKQAFKNADNIRKRIIYKKGPVKNGTRSKQKVEVEYNADKTNTFPTAAKLLDLNRCSIEFDDINELLLFLKQFTTVLDDDRNKTCIKHIVRCKNGWSIFDETNPNYCDIKLNVLISCNGVDIVGEIQLLLNIMSKYKKKAHKLYSIARKVEFIENFINLQTTLSSFENNEGRNDLYLLNAVLCYLCKKNDLFAYKEIKQINDEKMFKDALGLNSEIDGLTPIHHLTIAYYQTNQLKDDDNKETENEDLYKLIYDQYTDLFIDKISNKSLLMTSIIDGNIGYLVALKKQIKKTFFKMVFEKDNNSKTPFIYAAQYAQPQCEKFILNALNEYSEENDETAKLVKEYIDHCDKDNKTASLWRNEMMGGYIYLSSYNGFQLAAYNCKGEYLGKIMSCLDGENDDDEKEVTADDFDDEHDQWITGFQVDKHGNLYVASYLTFLAKYLPNKGGKLYRTQCSTFRSNMDRIINEKKLQDSEPEGVTTINDFKYNCILVSVMAPINGVMQFSLDGELLRIICQYKFSAAWSMKMIPYHFKDKMFNLDNNKRYFMIEDCNKLAIVDIDTDTIKASFKCTSNKVITKGEGHSGNESDSSDSSDDSDDDITIGDFCFIENGYGESILCINLQDGIVEFRNINDTLFDIIKRIDMNQILKVNNIKKKMRASYGFTIGPDGLFYLADTANNRIFRFKFVNDIHSRDKSPIDYENDIQFEVFATDVLGPNYTTWFNSNIFT